MPTDPPSRAQKRALPIVARARPSDSRRGVANAGHALFGWPQRATAAVQPLPRPAIAVAGARPTHDQAGFAARIVEAVVGCGRPVHGLVAASGPIDATAEQALEQLRSAGAQHVRWLPLERGRAADLEPLPGYEAQAGEVLVTVGNALLSCFRPALCVVLASGLSLAELRSPLGGLSAHADLVVTGRIDELAGVLGQWLAGQARD